MSNGKSKDSLPESTKESAHLEKSGQNGNSNGQQSHNLSQDRFKESQNVQLKDIEYIPNQIVSMIATSGVNTISNDRSGQCSSKSVRENEGITDSKAYRKSKALNETATNEKDNEPASKKRKSDSNDVSDTKTETPPNDEKCESANNQEEIVAEICDSISNDGTSENKSVSDVNPNSYMPSEYGSFQSSSGVSTFTKSRSSATEKIPTQSTDSSNVKGGIVHEDTIEK